MTDAELQKWAISTAREIMLNEGAEFALRCHDLDLDGVQSEATIFGATIARALIDAYFKGYEAALRRR